MSNCDTARAINKYMQQISQAYCDHEKQHAFSDGKMYVVCSKCGLKQIFDFITMTNTDKALAILKILLPPTDYIVPVAVRKKIQEAYDLLSQSTNE